MDPSLTEVDQKVKDTLIHLQRELSSIRAGRANPTLLEDLPVSAYGSRMKMVEVGTIAAPQPTLLTVTVWDPGVVKDVEKAIQEANLGLNPSVDGQTVRVPIPPLTEERREEYVKLAHQKGEAARVSLRQIRNDQRDEWKKEKESGEISEDEFFRREKLLQEMVDKYNAEIDSHVKHKEEELRQI
jgi:ribosome recycling factor